MYQFPIKNFVGQVPGQLYDARAVDQNGNGIYAGFFYLDAEGKQIMADTYTDANGYFHFTVPAYNHENIFVQLYASEEYEPVVKTFTEIVENPNVVIPKKKSNAPIILLIGGLGLLAISTPKQVGKIEGGKRLKEKWDSFKSNPQNKKIGFTALAIGGVGLAIWFILKYKPTAAQKAFLDNAKKRLEYLAKELGVVPSLTDSQYQTMVTQIVRSLDKCGTDEGAIQRAFAAMNNEADFWMLCIKFGIQKYDGCFEGNLPSWNVHYTLPEALASDLNDAEIYNLNMLLQQKQINITL